MHAHTHEVEVKKVDRLSPTQVRLTIAFSGKTLSEHEAMMARQYSQSASIPGFRPGKAPMKMVLERFRDNIQRDVVSHLLEAGLSEALDKTKLMPISRPKIQIGKISFQNNEPLEFQAEFEVEPEIQIKGHKGIPLKKASVEVAAEEVEKTVESLRERLGVLEPTDETKPFPGAFGVVEVGYTVVGDPGISEKPSSFTVELGRGSLIPDIDKAFMEMTLGEARTVEGTFPEDYHEKSLSGKTAKFDCKILELKKRTLPELNDAFAESVRPGLTLEALRSEIQKNIQQSKERDLRRTQRQHILDHLIKHNPFEVPRSLTEVQARKLLDSMAQDFKAKGQPFPQLKEEEMKAVWQSAEEIVRGGLVLRQVAEQEKIELSEQKLQERFSELAQQWNQSTEEVQKRIEKQGVIDRLKDELLTDQIFDFLIGNAKLQN